MMNLQMEWGKRKGGSRFGFTMDNEGFDARTLASLLIFVGSRLEPGVRGAVSNNELGSESIA